MKLTKPQRDLLAEAVGLGKVTCGADYKPARRLVELGLAISHEGRLGGHWITPTPEGRDALALSVGDRSTNSGEGQ